MFNWLSKKMNGCICEKYCGCGIGSNSIHTCATKIAVGRRKFIKMIEKSIKKMKRGGK